MDTSFYYVCSLLQPFYFSIQYVYFFLKTGNTSHYDCTMIELPFTTFNVFIISGSELLFIKLNILIQVQQGTAVLERTSASIARSTAIAVETEQVGTGVLGELGTQRETLNRTRSRLIDTDGELSRSKRIIRSISHNVLYNKILLIIIILLECGILGAVIYWKFFMK